MKEYTYEIQHSWEKQRRPIATEHQHQHRHHNHQRCIRKDDTGIDADASSMSGTYNRF